MAFKKALVVDDSKLARITLKKKLEQRGLQVAMAESGPQALELLRSGGGSELESVDIIFMDHLMPDLDGFETTQQIKADPALQHIPVVMCSGKENENYLQEAQAIGATGVLSKPPETSALEAILALEVPTPVVALDVSVEESIEVPVLDELEHAAPSLQIVGTDTAVELTETVAAETIIEEAKAEETTAEETSPDVIPGLDREAVVALIQEHLPEVARQREDILAELSNTQMRVLEDFSGGVDQQLTAHQDALAQLRMDLAAFVENQRSTPALDEAEISSLIETRLSAHSEAQKDAQAAELQAQNSNIAQVEHQFDDQLEALGESTLQTEVKLSAMEERLQQKFAEFEQKLSELPADSQGDAEQIDWEAITEQASRAAVGAAQQGIQQTVEQVIDQRIGQISTDISDQVQLQITYQLSQLEEKSSSAIPSTPTVDQAMGLDNDQIQSQVQILVEEQLKSKLAALQGELQKMVSPDPAAIAELIDERLAAQTGGEENTGMDASLVSQQQLDEMAGQFAQTQQQMVSRSRRTTVILALFVGLSALAVIAQWMP